MLTQRKSQVSTSKFQQVPNIMSCSNHGVSTSAFFILSICVRCLLTFWVNSQSCPQFFFVEWRLVMKVRLILVIKSPEANSGNQQHRILSKADTSLQVLLMLLLSVALVAQWKIKHDFHVTMFHYADKLTHDIGRFLFICLMHYRNFSTAYSLYMNLIIAT